MVEGLEDNGGPGGSRPPERKRSAASVLAGPRTAVTRWNRKVIIGLSAAFLLLVGLGFMIGFGGFNVHQKKAADTQAADTDTPQSTDVGNRFSGYGDPALHPPVLTGAAALPPPEAATDANSASKAQASAAAAQADAARAAALAQATAAEAASPFFGSGDGEHSQTPSSLTLAASSEGQSAGVDAPSGAGQNGQAEKLKFAATARAEDYLLNPLREPISPWEIKAGTVIAAALLTSIDSDLPGEAIAQVTEPVYDHATGKTVLIPQGSRLIGKYDSQIVYGQERALIAWNRIVMPNGRSINIGAMEGADLSGSSGLHDRTDQHFWQLAKGVVLSTLFSVGAASAQDANARSSGSLVLNAGTSGVSTEAQEVGQRITQRDLNRQPTITVRAGWPLRVIVNKDMILAPYPLDVRHGD